MKWIDIHEIAIELSDKHDDYAPTYILFTDLHALVTNLEDFDDDPNYSYEKILEAIQMSWIEVQD